MGGAEQQALARRDGVATPGQGSGCGDPLGHLNLTPHRLERQRQEAAGVGAGRHDHAGRPAHKSAVPIEQDPFLPVPFHAGDGGAGHAVG